MENKELLEIASSLVNKKEITEEVYVAGVGSALITKDGNLYKGVSLLAPCGIGFCAEYTAIAAMMTNGEFVIEKIATSGRGRYYPPCGRCRELMFQVSRENLDTEVIIDENESVKLRDILQYRWQEVPQILDE